METSTEQPKSEEKELSKPGKLLTTDEVLELGIVTPDNPRGRRPTTVDASIGAIVTKDGVCKEHCAIIPPRGIAWIMSAERFQLPSTVTGITTLRTTWTRKGILTLTVGIVDPGYDGYLGTAVINFSKNDFTLAKGETFFRTAFFAHDEVEGIDRIESKEDYLSSVEKDAAAFSETFLTIDSLATDILPKLFGLPRWGIRLALLGLALSVIGLCLPLAWGLNEGLIKWEMSKGQFDSLDQEVDQLRAEGEAREDAHNNSLSQLRAMVESLEQQIAQGAAQLPQATTDEAASTIDLPSGRGK